MTPQDKASLRKAYRQKRKALSDEEVETRSHRIAARFLEFFDELDQPIRYVHSFLPIQKKKEVNTWPIVEALREREGIHIVIAKSDFEEGRMEHFLLEKDTLIVKNEMGIPEPETGTPIPEDKIDLVLLPLLAYDEQGDRVGYGAGFYDRFLAACRSDVLKVGLSFFGPEKRIADLGEHDLKLDHCVTPGRVYGFQ